MTNVNTVEAVIKSDMTVKSRQKVLGGVTGKVAVYVATTEDKIYILEAPYTYMYGESHVGRYTPYELIVDEEDKAIAEEIGVDLAFGRGYGFHKNPIDYMDLPLVVKSEALKQRHKFKCDPKAVIFPEGSEE